MGSSKKQTVGYRYYLGAHLALCSGPVDAIREIRVDDKTAWSATTGEVSDGGTASQTILGAPSDMAAVAGDDAASVSFTGSVAGVKIGSSYELDLADGSSETVEIASIVYSAAGITTWSVTPATLAFEAQSVTVLEAATAVSNSGARGGRIYIDEWDLFGGDSREGGIQGDVDIMMGEPTQEANDYLVEQRGGQVPAYRGLCSLVLRQVYMGINPYLKAWSARVTRVLSAEGGEEQWYSEKAQIMTSASIGEAAIYIALDSSGSMYGTPFAAMKEAVAQMIEEIGANADDDEPNDIRIVLWGDSILGSIEREEMDADDYAEVAAWVRAQSSPVSEGTNYSVGLASSVDFFEDSDRERNVVIFVTDGKPSSGSMSDAKSYLSKVDSDVFCFNIGLTDTTYTSQLDNTPLDDVPVVASGDTKTLIYSLRNAFGTGPDMNGAHIVRECLTNTEWGLGYADSEIGDSFTAAADTLYDEEFGLSFLWQDDGSIEDFISTVLTHINASVYVDRHTGLWEIKLIRDDYDTASLPVFDETNVVDWGTLTRRMPSETVNSVTLKYTSALTENTAAVTVTDVARVMELGDPISTTVDFPGIRYQNLAVRVAERELLSLSAPLRSGTIKVNRDGADLNIGDVIILNSSRRGFDSVAMRITEVGIGKGSDNAISLTVAEDVFRFNEAAIVGGSSKGASSLSVKPKKLTRRMVEEAPYWLLVQAVGHDQAESSLASDQTAGVLMAAGEMQSAQIVAAQLWVDPGTGSVEDETSMPVVPSALLAEELSDDPEATTVSVSDWLQIGDVEIGSLAWLDGELVRVDGISATSVTLGRGCLDTAPHAHASGAALLFFGPDAAISQTQYEAAEELTVRLLPESASAVLAFSAAPEDTTTFDSRAFRPLPPGNVRANGSYLPESDALVTGDLALTWAHRDRLSQTSSTIADYLAASIGPETGTDYVLEIYWVDPETEDRIQPAAATIEVGSGASYTLTEAELPLDDAPEDNAEIDIVLRSRRDGLLCRDFRAMRFISPEAIGWDGAWDLAWGE